MVIIEQAAAAGSAGNSAGTGAIIANLVSTGALSQIWSMINGMQIFVHLPLFQVGFDNYFYSNEVLKKIIEIANFEVLPVGDLIELVLPAPESEDEEYLESAENIGYEAHSTVGNLGALFAILIMTLTLPPTMAIAMRFCKRHSARINSKYESLTNALYGNMFIRYLLEACLEISICVFLEYYYMTQGDS